jgi:hypothetical protein
MLSRFAQDLTSSPFATRSDFDGGNIVIIVPPGETFTPKQLQIETKSGKLYWSDREAMGVMRCNLDGSSIQTLVQNGHTEPERLDAMNWCVGVAIDPLGGKLY